MEEVTLELLIYFWRKFNSFLLHQYQYNWSGCVKSFFLSGHIELIRALLSYHVCVRVFSSDYD